MVLEYLDGGTMYNVLEARSKKYFTSRFTYEEVLQQGIQLADALNYLHSKVIADEVCIIHRGKHHFYMLIISIISTC